MFLIGLGDCLFSLFVLMFRFNYAVWVIYCVFRRLGFVCVLSVCGFYVVAFG